MTKESSRHVRCTSKSAGTVRRHMQAHLTLTTQYWHIFITTPLAAENDVYKTFNSLTWLHAITDASHEHKCLAPPPLMVWL